MCHSEAPEVALRYPVFLRGSRRVAEPAFPAGAGTLRRVAAHDRALQAVIHLCSHGGHNAFNDLLKGSTA
jgi:hypothetical protein